MLELKKICSCAVAVMMLVSLTACSSGKIYYTVDTEQETTGKSSIENGPHLYIGNTTAKAGELADVTLYVENAQANWTMCGIHVTYPDILEVDMFDPEQRLIRYERGEASNYSTASVSKVWVDNLPEELSKNHLGCLFFTEVFDGNQGLDGDIFTFHLKIPENAKSGTVYPIGFYYLETDMFINSENDLELQQYAFDNWTEGSITIE